MNANRIVIHSIPYISLHVSTSILGRTAETLMLCAHVTQHRTRELQVTAFTFTGAFSVSGRYRWEAPVFADWQATVCVQQKTSDILKLISAWLSMPMLVTQHNIFFYWLSYAKALWWKTQSVN